MGFTEPVNVWQRTNRTDGGNAAFADFFVEGLKTHGPFVLATAFMKLPPSQCRLGR